jgi:hypothetical protein
MTLNGGAFGFEERWWCAFKGRLCRLGGFLTRRLRLGLGIRRRRWHSHPEPVPGHYFNPFGGIEWNKPAPVRFGPRVGADDFRFKYKIGVSALDPRGNSSELCRCRGQCPISHVWVRGGVSR